MEKLQKIRMGKLLQMMVPPLSSACTLLAKQGYALCQQVVVAERLRRWTRNPLGFPRAGSNPADNELLFKTFPIDG